MMLDTSQPSEPRRAHERGRKILALALCAAGLLVLTLPLRRVTTSLSEHLAYLDTSLNLAREELAVATRDGLEIEVLRSTLDAVHASVSSISALEELLREEHVDWPAVMSVLRSRDPTKLALRTITQDGRRIRIEGRASDEAAVVAYAQSLEASPLFKRVVIQFIKVVDEPFRTKEPTPPSGASATTVEATRSATASPGDAFEPDEQVAKDLFLGHTQQHSFHPAGDTDRVRFLAKAWRYYKVYTSNLAPGVDTFLTVQVGDTIYTNDDETAGSLRSIVAFQVTHGYDAEVIVEISNRGAFGPDRKYNITAEEFIPTATPNPPETTATPSPEPATPTPVPANTHPASTSVPTNTYPAPTSRPSATATFDVRDRYEPDDWTPRVIELGETQAHSFYPRNDIDTVVFETTPGRCYRVSTFGLAPLVDTLLVVETGGVRVTNNDREEDDLSSEITFWAPSKGDARAVISILNLGTWGPGQWYRVTITDVSAAYPRPAQPQGSLAPRRVYGLASLGGQRSQSSRHLVLAVGVQQSGTGQRQPARVDSSKAVEFVMTIELEDNAW